MQSSACKIEPQLRPITFIAGNAQTFYFEINDEKGKAIDVSDFELSFVLSRYDIRISDPVLKKSGEYIPTNNKNLFKVDMTSSDSFEFEGKYCYQVSLKQEEDIIYEVGQGFCTIVRNLNR